jgi:hypothetical protein
MTTVSVLFFNGLETRGLGYGSLTAVIGVKWNWSRSRASLCANIARQRRCRPGAADRLVPRLPPSGRAQPPRRWPRATARYAASASSRIKPPARRSNFLTACLSGGSQPDSRPAENSRINQPGKFIAQSRGPGGRAFSRHRSDTGLSKINAKQAALGRAARQLVTWRDRRRLLVGFFYNDLTIRILNKLL